MRTNRIHFIGCNPYAAMIQPKQQASFMVVALIIAFLKFFSKIDFK